MIPSSTGCEQSMVNLSVCLRLVIFFALATCAQSGIVDTVANHCDCIATLLQVGHNTNFLVGQNACNDMLLVIFDADLKSNCCGGCIIVAGQ